MKGKRAEFGTSGARFCGAAAGLVGRERVPGDRRGVCVVLTAEGESAYERAIAQHRADIEREFGSRLTPGQQQAVAAALAQFWQ